MRDVVRGLTAAAAALCAMAAVSLAALLLLDAGRIGDLGPLTAAVVALAVGGTATIDAAPSAGLPSSGLPSTGLPSSGLPSSGLPITVHGVIDVLPLGVSLVGAVVLGSLLLRRGREGLPVRTAAAAAAFAAGLAATALAARGNLAFRPPAGFGTSGCGPNLPFRGGFPRSLSAAFSVDFVPAAAAAAFGVLAVAAVCWAALRFRAFAAGLRGALIATGALTAVCLLAAATFGGAAAAGGVLLVLPQAGSAVLLLGLGLPMTLPCGAGPSLTWVSAVVLLGCGIVVAARTRHRPGGPVRRAAVIAVRLASVLGAVLGVLALLSRVSVELSIAVFSFSIPVLGANPLLALAAGLAGGAPAGFAGSLLVDGFRSRSSVSSRTWKG